MLPDMFAVRVKYIDNELRYWLGESDTSNSFVVLPKSRRKYFSTLEDAEQAIQMYQATIANNCIEYFEIVHIQVIENELVCKKVKNND